MSSAHLSWSPLASTDRPMILTLRFSNSGWILAMYPSSVVQTGVKSLGWENRTAHESPIQSWKLIGPCVVSASKSGAVSPSDKPIVVLLLVGDERGHPKRTARQRPRATPQRSTFFLNPSFLK